MRRPLFRTALLALLASGLLSTPTVRAATAPTRPTIGTATASSGAATIRFTPASAQPRGVVVSSYTASCTTSGTTTVRTGTVSGATASAVTVSSLTNGKTYRCSVKAKSSAGVFSTASGSVSVTPVAAPNPPTIGTATASSGQAVVRYTAVAQPTGVTITSYTASCTTSGSTTPVSATSTSAAATSITVTGLTNGKTYACSVKAKSSGGVSSGASGTVSVTPASPSAPNAPTLRSVAPGDAQITVNFSAASTQPSGVSVANYTGSCLANGSSTPITTTGTEATATAVTVKGLTNGTSYACSVKTNSSAALSSAASCTATATPTAVASSPVAYATPAQWSSVLSTAYAPCSLSSAATLTTRSRYLLSDQSTAITTAVYLGIGSSASDYSATTGYAVKSGTIGSAATYETYVSKLIQAVGVTAASGTATYYRFDSHLHPNNSLDADSTDGYKLKFRNNFGKASTTYGYVTFSYDNTTKKLQARERYTYSLASATSGNSKTYTATYTRDTSFGAANYYVNLTSGVYTLVAAAASATSFYFYDSPLDYSIPAAMNPTGTSYVTNGTAPFISKLENITVEGTSGTIYQNLSATYRPQASVAGSSPTTKTAADAKLTLIKQAVEGAGSTLRYDPSVYIAFRDAALQTTLGSDAISDGTPGQNLVPYVYFTNEQDDGGTYHPFMIVVSYANPATPHGLGDVPRPPGDGTGGSYPNSKVTRYTNREQRITRIPMKDYGTVSAVTDNASVMDSQSVGTLWGDVTTTQTRDVYNYASKADNGLMINGAVMFPAYNNTLVFSQSQGELTANGCHVGQGGGGPHCHADGYQGQRGPGVALYGDADYVGKNHPPLIGFGYDGVALFGVYRTQDTAMKGYGSLDSFGGHNHDSIGYHYHAHTVSATATTTGPNPITYSYKVYVMMKGAYIGNITSVPLFGTGGNWSTDKYLGGQGPEP